MAQCPRAAEHPCRKLPCQHPQSHPHAAFPDLPIRGIVNNLQSRRIAREAGISQLCAARYLERAIAFAVCGRLPEPAGEEPDARRGDGGITFCRYVGSPQNHCRPSCPELFALADGRSGGQGLREVKITVDGATVSWSSGGCDTAAVAGIVRSLRAVKEERGNGGE